MFDDRSPGAGVYLFCFTRPLAPELLPGSGSGDAAVFQETVGELAAVCGRARLEDFCGPAGERNLQDLAWVGPRALRHQEVIAAVMRHGPVLPVRFGAIFSSPERLRELTGAHAAAIADFLRFVADKEEWAAKGFLDAAAAEAGLLATDPELMDQARRLPAAPGARYFQEKKLHQEARRRVQGWARQAVGQVREALVAAAVDARPLRLLAPSEAGPEMVLHASFLVARDRLGDFQALVDRLQATLGPQGLALDLSGPWPPFSFAPSLGPEGATGP